MGTILAASIFVFPGALWVRRAEWKRAEPMEIAGVAFAGSAAFWAVAFWALAVVPLSLKVFAQAALASSFLACAVWRAGSVKTAWIVWRTTPRFAAWQFGAIALVLLLRLSFVATRVAYSGGDMTAHATLAEEIVLADGFPKTQEPLAPISHFGQIAPGFHVLAALITLFSGLATDRSTIWALCASMAGTTFTLYALLRRLAISPGPAAAGSGLALVLARNPQFFLQWGGAPSILAAAVGFLALSDALGLAQRRSLGFLARTGLLAAGTIVIHVLPAVSLAWLAPPILLSWCWVSGGSWRQLTRNAAGVAACATALAFPFLRQAPRSVPPPVAAWAHDWFRAEIANAAELQGRLAPFLGTRQSPASWPFYLVTYLGALAAIGLAAGLARGLWLGRRAATLAVLLVAGNAWLFAGALTESLPGWPALYPTRIGLWLAISVAVAFGQLADDWNRFVPGAWPRVALGMIFAAAFGVEGWRLSANRLGTSFYGAAKSGAASIASVLVNEAAGGAFWVTTFCQDNATVTAEDLAAFAWIRTHTPPTAVFANNPGDGGPLLPAAAHRKILEPHYYWFFDAAQVQSWRAHTPVDYVFVGSRPAPPWGRRWTAEALDRDPRVALIWRLGQARVYRVREEYRAAFR